VGQSGRSLDALPWNWRMRLGMAGMLLPLAVNILGLLWPFVGMPTYCYCYRGLHKLLACCAVAGKVLEDSSGLPGLQGSCQQYLLVHAFLFIVPQVGWAAALGPLQLGTAAGACRSKAQA
jgi:hypothetical protein